MVLIDSGDETSVELWDPESLRFSRASAPEIHTRNFTATALSDGRVLVSGGQNLGGHEEARAEIWDDGEWTRTGELATPRAGHRAVLLSRDRVLITGGKNTRVGLVAASEIWEPSTGRFIRAGTMLAGRSGHAVVSLGRDRVLAIGGTMIEAEDELGAELFGDWPEGQDDARL